MPQASTHRPAHPTRRQRSRWGSISREQVVTAALRAVEDGGYERMTIRSLAAELGVAPMSLYRHVRDKDDLLVEITDRLLAGTWRPRARESHWHRWLTEAADRLRELIVTQPAALHVYTRQPVASPAAVDRMEAMIRVLRVAGASSHAAKRAYAAIQTYTIGFAALEASRARWAPSDEDVTGLGHELAAYTSPHQFAEGLNYLLDGIRRRARLSA